jgi:hypothetical protein
MTAQQTYFASQQTNRGGYPMVWAQMVIFPKSCVWRFHVFYHSRVPTIAWKQTQAFNSYAQAAAAAQTWVSVQG